MSSRRTGSGPQIENPANLPISAEEERILKTMFAPYGRVTIKEEFSGGLSGSRVLLVRPIESEHSPELPAVVKIAPTGLIRSEWHAYNRCVRHKLPGIAEITDEPVLPPGSLWGGLRYTLMGEGGTFEVESLRTYYHHASAADIRCVLRERLFAIAGPQWWQFSEAKAEWPIQASYDFLLPVNLLIEPAVPPPDISPHPLKPDTLPPPPLSQGDYVRLEGFVITEVDPQQKALTLNVPAREDGLPASYRLRLQPVESIESYQVNDEIPPIEGRVRQTRHEQLRCIAQGVLEYCFDLTSDTLTSPHGTRLPNPLAALPALLGKTRNLRVSCIHGDLNMENIMVEPAGRTVSLIDFATARRDHTLHDFLRLETEVITRLLPEALPSADLLVETIDILYRRLHQETFAPDRPVRTLPIQAGLDKPFQMLAAIRQMGRQCLFDPDDWTEYYEGLTLYLLGALKFKNLDRLSRQAAFWAAAVAYNFVQPAPSKRPPTSKDWSRLHKYLPTDVYQQKDEAACLGHLNSLLRAVLTYLPRHLALDLLQEPLVAHTRGEFLEGTLLFADISDFTAISEKLRKKGEKEGAEEIARLINEFLDVMLAILFKYNGQLIKFGGDAMLCLFTGEYQGALNAVWAAWEMRQAMADRFARIEVLQEIFPLEMKAGSNSGLLFAANVGTAEHMEYVLTGSAVERAARAESTAGKGDILVSSETYSLVEGYLEAEPLAAVPDFYRVTHVRAEPAVRPEDPWNEVERFLSTIEGDLWEVADRLDALCPYLPAGLLPQLARDTQGGQIEGQHRQVTILFANFTGMDRVINAHGVDRPDRIAADLGEYFEAVQEEIQYYGGVINKVDLYDQGDKLMVIFGAPMAHEQDIRRAALTALAMREVVARLPSPTASALLSQRMGIHTGSVFAGNVGSCPCHRREYTVMGDTVNLAARLMSEAGRGEIWISQSAWSQIRGGFDASALPPVKVKGLSDPIVAYQLHATRPVQGRVRPRVLDSDFVGRKDELEVLEACFDDLSSGGGKQIAAITGEAGVGKTRLVTEWQHRIRTLAGQGVEGPAVAWLCGRGHSYGQKTHGVFVEVLEQLLAFAAEDSHQERWRKLSDCVEKMFTGAAPGWSEEFSNRLAYLAQFLALDLTRRTDLSERVAQLEPEALQLQTRLAICDLLVHAARQQPLIVVLEDLHWADDASLDLLKFVLDRVDDDIPILFCLIYRALKERPIWQVSQEIDHAHPDCHSISLQELGHADGRQLLSNLMRNDQLSEDFQALVLEEADGNPLYVEEILHTLIEEGTLVQDEGRWQLTRSLEQIHVPATLYQIVQSRIDELDYGSPGARRVLWMAAVIGEEFPEELLRHLFTSTGRQEEELSRHLRELRNAAMIEKTRIRHGGRLQWGYRFRHGLVQQVAYENILVGKQREYHRQIGRWLEEQHRQDLPQYYDTLAYHYDQGREWGKAFQYHRLTGQRDAQAYANQDALSHLRRALEIAGFITPGIHTLAYIHLELGKVLVTLGEYDDALKHLTQAYDLLGDTLDPDVVLRKARMCYHISYAYAFKGSQDDLETALAWQGKGVALLPKTPAGEEVPSAEAAALHVVGGFVPFRRGNFEQAIEEGQRALRLAEKADARLDLAVTHRLLSVAYGAHGSLDLAMEHCERSIEVSREIGDLSGLLKGYSNRGVFALEMDNWDLAEASYLRAIEILNRVGDRFELGKTYANLGDLYCHRGEIEKGLDYAHRALEIFDAIQAASGTIIAHAVLATLLWRQGALEQALTQLSDVRELAQDTMFEPTVRRWLAQIYLTRGNTAQAQAEIQELLSTGADVLADEAEPIQRLWGEILAAQGEPEEANRVLEASLDRLEQRRKRYQAARTRLVLARVLAQVSGRAEEALAHAGRARATFAELGARLDLREAEQWIAGLGE